MNRVYMIGRTTKDVDLKTSSNGRTIARFNLAVDRRFKDQDGNSITDFFNCVAFGALADTIGKYVKKGNKIAIDGELWTNTYENEKGEKRSSTSICVATIEFLEKKEGTTGATQENKQELIEIDDDGLPF